jgi:predicted alpha/beta superfamily hydrolase
MPMSATSDVSPLPDTDVHFFRSDHVGDEFKIVVGHCGSSDAALPVPLLMGDTWMHFGTAVEVVRALRLTEVVPPVLVVGVGYRTTDLGETFRLRHRDFTPTVARSGSAAGTETPDGAGRFLAFLTDELKPWLRERYPVAVDDSMFFGDSRGGLFATYVLLTEPSTFTRYGIGSPSLYRDEGVKSMFEQEAEYAQTHDDLAAKVSFTVGGYENPDGYRRRLEQLAPDHRARMEADPGDWAEDYVGDTERMVTTLRGRAYPSLQIEHQVLPGEYHETAVPMNLSRSLRYLFDSPR